MVNGVLNTTQWGPHGLQQYNYSSVPIPTEGASEDFNFQFQPEVISSGNLGVSEAYFPSLLLTVNGADGYQPTGFIICPDQGEDVVMYHDKALGPLDAACNQTYLHLVYQEPYSFPGQAA